MNDGLIKVAHEGETVNRQPGSPIQVSKTVGMTIAVNVALLRDVARESLRAP